LGWKVVGIGFFVMTAPGSPVMTVILSLAIASADEGSADLGQLAVSDLGKMWRSFRSSHITMRSHIAVDEKLMNEALKVTGARTKREAVELGLKTLLQLNRQAAIRQLRGAVQWTGDLEAIRTDAPK
jgi:Arc/MetJ family transcription regulator